MRTTARLLALALLLPACGGSPAADDAGVADMASAAPDLATAPDLAGAPKVSVFGRLIDLRAAPVAGATVGIAEQPMNTTTSDMAGRWKLEVPQGQPITFVVTASGFAKTVEQEIIVHKTFMDFILPMAAQADYDAIQKAGGGAAGTGVVGIVVGQLMSCTVDGFLLGITPPSGKVLYVPAMSDGGMPWAPDPSLTTAQKGPLINAYVAGATGKVTPTAMSMKCPTAQFPFRVNNLYTVVGPVTVEAGAYHDVQVFID